MIVKGDLSSNSREYLLDPLYKYALPLLVFRPQFPFSSFLQFNYLPSKHKMFGFGESKDAYDQVEQGHHASLSHEAIAAAASFEVPRPPRLPNQAIDTC